MLRLRSEVKLMAARCNPAMGNTPLPGHAAAEAALAAIKAAPRRIATSTADWTDSYSERTGETTAVEVFRAGYWLDEWREEYAPNPRCVGNHRTHEAAVNCALRFAAAHGTTAQRLEDAEYV